MTVKARFRVTEIKNIMTNSATDVLAMITMIPVYNDGKGNESWSKYTPSGKLEMNVTNPAAIAGFDLGKVYELTFEPVPA